MGEIFICLVYNLHLIVRIRNWIERGSVQLSAIQEIRLLKRGGSNDQSVLMSGTNISSKKVKRFRKGIIFFRFWKVDHPSYPKISVSFSWFCFIGAWMFSVVWRPRRKRFKLDGSWVFALLWFWFALGETRIWFAFFFNFGGFQLHMRCRRKW